MHVRDAIPASGFFRTRGRSTRQMRGPAVVKRPGRGVSIAAMFLGAVACAAAARAAAPAPTPGPAEQYIDAQLRVVRSMEASLNAIADLADESAAKLLAGGTIYLAGEPGMVLELLGRAGGLSGAAKLPVKKPAAKKPPRPVGPGDIVLLSDYGTPGKLQAAIDDLAPTGALVIVFASAENPLVQKPSAGNFRVVPVDIPLDSRLVTLPDGQRLIPTASPALATAEWTFVAELLAPAAASTSNWPFF